MHYKLQELYMGHAYGNITNNVDIIKTETIKKEKVTAAHDAREESPSTTKVQQPMGA